MSKPIRPYEVGDTVILFTPVQGYSIFVGGDVGVISYLGISGKHVDVYIRGNHQQIDMSHIAHHSTKQTELFEGLTYG